MMCHALHSVMCLSTEAGIAASLLPQKPLLFMDFNSQLGERSSALQKQDLYAGKGSDWLSVFSVVSLYKPAPTSPYADAVKHCTGT